MDSALLEKTNLRYQSPTSIDPTIFRAYDIRGIVNENLTPEVIYGLGLAIGSESIARGEKQIIVGRDGRLSSPFLVEALHAGILQTGCDVIDIGLVPTPLVYFATYITNAKSGVMLTGSHNPANYNGLKIILNQKALIEEEIQCLYQRLIKKDFVSGSGIKSQQNLVPYYINRISQDVKLQKPLKIVIDSGNGAASEIAPKLLSQIGCDVIPLYCDIDGRFPNHHPDPTQPENLDDLIKTVKETGADIGFAFDGDADRLGIITSSGEIIWADRYLMLLTKALLEEKPGATILFDVKCSTHLTDIIRKHGGNPVIWKTGHSLIKNKMKEMNAELAGEMSGHIFYADRWYGFDDGIYVACRLLEIISQHDCTVDELFAQLPNSMNTPEIKIPMSEDKKFQFMKKLKESTNFPNANIIDIDGLRVEFENGWGLVRCSNTTPCLTLRFEADDRKTLKEIQALFKKQLLQIDGSLNLSILDV